jgi:hypothetical protein
MQPPDFIYQRSHGLAAEVRGILGVWGRLVKIAKMLIVAPAEGAKSCSRRVNRSRMNATRNDKETLLNWHRPPSRLLGEVANYRSLSSSFSIEVA